MKSMDRRDFIHKSLLGLAGGAIASESLPSALFGSETIQPSNRITLGVIGLGKQGSGHLRGFLHRSDVQIVALCDVDQFKLSNAQTTANKFYADKFGKGKYTSCAAYGDFRNLLDRTDIDAVVIATPDHWHALMLDKAAQAGKDIYCEKPLSLTVSEARHMVSQVRRYGRICQTGSQQRSDEKFRFACELVQNGYIGQLESISVSIETGFFPFPRLCTLEEEPIPQELNWDLWLGPAPYRPYHHAIAPPIQDGRWGRWRNYMDYSGGGMTDWGTHHFDIAQWGMGKDQSGPVQISPPNSSGHPLTYTYENGVTMTMSAEGNGVLFKGSEGEVFVNRSILKTSPNSLKKIRIKPDELHLYRSDDHKQNWIDSIRSRSLPICDIEIGCRSVTVCHLGNISERLQRVLQWDPVSEQFLKDDEANRLLHKPMRAPWRLS
ncbi:Gfo/Idh/MocA family protein [bacterium]